MDILQFARILHSLLPKSPPTHPSFSLYSAFFWSFPAGRLVLEAPKNDANTWTGVLILRLEPSGNKPPVVVWHFGGEVNWGGQVAQELSEAEAHKVAALVTKISKKRPGWEPTNHRASDLRHMGDSPQPPFRGRRK